MKRTGLFLIVFGWMVFPLYSYNPIIEPDPELLPSILDSTIHLSWNQDSSEWIVDDRRVYTYDIDGNLLSEEILGFADFWSDGHIRNVYAYDGNGNKVMEAGYEWNSDINDWLGLDSTKYEFDAMGNQIEYVTYHWNKNINNWLEVWKEEWEYDSNGLLTEIRSYNWDQQWQFTHKHLYTYDANGNLTEYIDLDYHNWEFVNGEFKETRTYDEYGNEIEHIWYEWDPDSNDWEGVRRYVKAYDVHGSQLEEIEYRWDTDAWVKHFRRTWTYNENGNPLDGIHFGWDSEINGWEYVQRTGYTYNASGNLTEEVIREWDSAEKYWRVADSILYKYDAHGNELEVEWLRWDADINGLVGIHHMISAFDANGMVLVQVKYDWDSDIHGWLNRDSTVNTYNANSLIIERSVSRWNQELNEWWLSDRYYAYWSKSGSWIQSKPEEELFKVFPNPVNAILNIQMEIPDYYTIEISGLNGRLIYYWEKAGSAFQIDIGSFESGIYFITIRSNDFVATRKIVKLR